jgi:hypothetical protein
MAERLDRAIGWLMGMLAHKSIMPPKQVERLDFIFDWRVSVSLKSLNGEWRIPSDAKDKKAIVEAIIALYEACLIDLGRSNDDSTAIIYDGLDERG